MKLPKPRCYMNTLQRCCGPVDGFSEVGSPHKVGTRGCKRVTLKVALKGSLLREKDMHSYWNHWLYQCIHGLVGNLSGSPLMKQICSNNYLLKLKKKTHFHWNKKSEVLILWHCVFRALILFFLLYWGHLRSWASLVLKPSFTANYYGSETHTEPSAAWGRLPLLLCRILFLHTCFLPLTYCECFYFLCSPWASETMSAGSRLTTNVQANVWEVLRGHKRGWGSVFSIFPAHSRVLRRGVGFCIVKL